MQQPKWTPGPWQVDPEDRYPNDVRIEGGELLATAYQMDKGGYRAACANARLIAAAPDLYKACIAFIDAWTNCLQLEKTDVARDLALAALAKARGESNGE